ncbi:MAG: LytTR family transcriptional regulator DNA-binding domain-containing protein [Saprospiraceae bacterium]
MADLLFVEANGKFINCHYYKGDESKKKVINASLKTFNALIENNPQFYKVHKSYIVNCMNVHDYGDYPEYFLKIPAPDHQYVVPISRERKLEFHNHYRRLLGKLGLKKHKF